MLAESNLRLGRAYAKRKGFKMAEETFLRVIDLSERSGGLLDLKGYGFRELIELYFRERILEKSESKIQEILDCYTMTFGPNNTPVGKYEVLRGQMAAALGDLDLAKERWQRALWVAEHSETPDKRLYKDA